MTEILRRICGAIALVLLLTAARSASAQSTCPTIAQAHDIIGKIADACSDGCRETDILHRFAILKDNSAKKRAAYLLVARDCNATGIEAADVLSVAPLLDAWAYAWNEAEKWIEPNADTQIASVPAWIGLEVNAGNVDDAGRELSRSMDRLHIHMACVRPDVVVALRSMQGDTATMRFAEEPGVEFTISRTPSLRGASSPFLLLPADRSAWRNRTIAVFGQRDTAMFYVAVGTGPAGQQISGEDLLDQMCA